MTQYSSPPFTSFWNSFYITALLGETERIPWGSASLQSGNYFPKRVSTMNYKIVTILGMALMLGVAPAMAQSPGGSSANGSAGAPADNKSDSKAGADAGKDPKMGTPGSGASTGQGAMPTGTTMGTPMGTTMGGTSTSSMPGTMMSCTPGNTVGCQPDTSGTTNAAPVRAP
jgi:hypothetical protein